jgi:CubicO group peptidase (beta-lactamase class C family)
MKLRYWLTLLALLTSGCEHSGDHDANNSAEGLSWWRTAVMAAFIDYRVFAGDRSGYVVLLARDGELVYSRAAGLANIDSGQLMAANTRMRFASMTKPVTAVAALKLMEMGALKLDDPVANYIAGFADTRVATSEQRNGDGEFDTEALTSPLRVRHLLMFASGVGPGFAPDSDLVNYWQSNGLWKTDTETLAERVDRLAQLPLFEQPGQRWRYGASADVLARVVEVASKQPFDQFLQQHIFTPLAMTNTSFLPPEDQQQGIAKVYTQDADGKLVAAPRKYDALTWTPGGSGLVSTADDYMRFALMLWNQGEWQGVRILQPETVRAMTSVQLDSGVLAARGIDGIGWGLGVSVIVDEEKSLLPGHTGDYGWSGYYGTSFTVSPSTGMVAIVLTQNEPGEFSGQPIGVYLLQSLAGF